MERKKRKGDIKMGIVKVNDNLRIDIESRNLTLQRKNVIQSGENKGGITWVNEGYYTNWESLFAQIVRNCIVLKTKDKELKDLKELRKVFIETKKEISELLKDFI